MTENLKWNGKLIKELSNNELQDAIFSIASVDKFRVDKLGEARKRHETLFKTHPPTENPKFTELALALQSEFKSRGLT